MKAKASVFTKTEHCDRFSNYFFYIGVKVKHRYLLHNDITNNKTAHRHEGYQYLEKCVKVTHRHTHTYNIYTFFHDAGEQIEGN